MTSVNHINLFEYDDYRRFLKAWVDGAKAEGRPVSLATLGAKAGLSKMAVKYLLDGKRHLAEASIDRMARALALGGTERAFFRHLVLFNKARQEAERATQFEAMLALRKSPFKELLLDHDEVGYFRRWYYPAIAEMSYLAGFEPDPAWIQPRLRFKVAKDAIAEALAYLAQRGYLKGGARTDAKVKLPPGFRSQVYRSYAIEQTGLGATALGAQPASEREAFTLTISVDAERFAAAKTMVAAFRQKLHDELANDARCTRVIQVNVQMFTVADAEVKS